MTLLRSFSKADIAKNTRIYNIYHKDYGWIDGWDRDSKMENFLLMAKIARFSGVPIKGSSCLDVGCGTGDLSLFLRQRGAKAYVGIDIYKPSLVRARAKYPKEQFSSSDILTRKSRRRYDYAFCSGTLSIKLQNADNYDFLESMVTKMWRLTQIGVVFNILTTDPRPDPDLFFYETARVRRICRRLTANEHMRMIKSTGKKQAHFYLWHD